LEGDALILESAQLSALTRTLEAGASVAASPRGIEAALSQSAVCTLSEFPEHAVFDGSDMLACVRLPLRGSLRGVGIFALDPHGVMHLVGRRQAAPDPGLVPRYLSLGSGLVQGLATSLARPLGAEPEIGAPELVEGSLVHCILGTHALPGTAVVSGRMRLTFAGTSLSGVVYLLLDPKLAARLIGSL
jgi:hypothetical protein